MVTMSDLAQFLVFRLDDRRYALPLNVVERVVRAVEVTALPKAPGTVLGLIDVHGRLMPVLNVRRRFLMPGRDVSPADSFLLAHTARRAVALVIDESDGVLEWSQGEVGVSTQIASGLESFPGVLRLDDGLVLIHDLETFLSFDEAAALDAAMDETSGT